MWRFAYFERKLSSLRRSRGLLEPRDPVIYAESNLTSHVALVYICAPSKAHALALYGQWNYLLYTGSFVLCAFPPQQDCVFRQMVNQFSTELLLPKRLKLWQDTSHDVKRSLLPAKTFIKWNHLLFFQNRVLGEVP